MKIKKDAETIILLAILLIYLLFPSTNSSNDSYFYAAAMRYGIELFAPFHLLYNVFGLLIFRVVSLIKSVDVLAMMKVVNSLATVGSLYILLKILKSYVSSREARIWLTAFVAFSFGVIRYATENETYILPILVSIYASLLFLKHLKEPSTTNIILISFIGALSCLFHVLHVFWWIGLLIGIYLTNKKISDVLWYIAPAFIVPIFYLAVIYTEQNQNLTFAGIWNYFYGISQWDSITYDVGGDNFLLGIINFFRTFFQVHGNILYLIKKNPILFVNVILVSTFLLMAAIRLFRNKLVTFSKPDLFVKTQILIFILQLIFALYSKGNAEFMIMLPFLFVIIVAVNMKFDRLFMAQIVISLFVWNMSFGVLPYHFLDLNRRDDLVDFVMKNPEQVYIVDKRFEIQNRIFYLTGIDDFNNVMPYPKDENSFTMLYDSAREQGLNVFTDYNNDQPKIIDRHYMTQKNSFSYFDKCSFEVADTLGSYFGNSYLFRLVDKD